MDTVGQPLASAKVALDSQHIAYTITVTQPAKPTASLDNENLYVVRQLKDDDGQCHLLVAAKMGKRV